MCLAAWNKFASGTTTNSWQDLLNGELPKQPSFNYFVGYQVPDASVFICLCVLRWFRAALHCRSVASRRCRRRRGTLLACSRPGGVCVCGSWCAGSTTTRTTRWPSWSRTCSTPPARSPPALTAPASPPHPAPTARRGRACRGHRPVP